MIYLKPILATSVHVRQILEDGLNRLENARLGPAALDIVLLDSEFGRRMSGLVELVRLSRNENEALRGCAFLGPENHLKTMEVSPGQ